MDREVSNGRSGRGGALHPDDIQLLRKAVQEAWDNSSGSDISSSTSDRRRPPQVAIIQDTNETFWERRQPQLMKYRNTRNNDGNLTYFPYTEPTYVYPDTIDNIVKQWHSIDAVWRLMEEHVKSESPVSSHPQNKRKYERVAMMRSDVIYITPIDMFASPTKDSEPLSSGSAGGVQSIATTQHSSPPVIIPDFGKWPINDRLIMVWATQRFRRIDDFAKVAAPGTAMHSETFLNASILTSIEQDLHLSILQDPWLCFLRVRADGAIWIEDCDATKSGNGGGYPGNVMEQLHPFLPQNVTCRKRFLRDKVRRIRELICGDRSGTALAGDHSAAREMMMKRMAERKRQIAGVASP
ncbi:MAG: hypothetical protein SGARI_005223 [Bacillariaceae sp.]